MPPKESVPLALSIQYGEGDILQVEKEIAWLCKLNYDVFQLGVGRPMTIKYSATSCLRTRGWVLTSGVHNFKYYACL